MQSTIKIGTRESELAMWQANLVKSMLEDKGFATELVPVTSMGDQDLITPLYQMGVQGIFTKSLDVALLNKRIDIAVHSMKDVPTTLPQGIVQAGVLARGNYEDILVPQTDDQNVEHSLQQTNSHNVIIATSSTRRRAQWLHKYPLHQITNIRGNVNTRLAKLSEAQWTGAIFAAAGLERLGRRPHNALALHWMLPAPSQGAICIASLASNTEALNAAGLLNDANTNYCTSIEKTILGILMGGCTTPIGALATLHGNEVHVQANILSLDGSKKVAFGDSFLKVGAEHIAGIVAAKMLAQGGKEIVEEIRNAQAI